MHKIATCKTVTSLNSILYGFSFVFSGDASSEKQLINHLLETYSRVGRYGRPVKNTSLPVIVQFGLGLINLELDEKLKVLRMSMWAKYVSGD